MCVCVYVCVYIYMNIFMPIIDWKSQQARFNAQIHSLIFYIYIYIYKWIVVTKPILFMLEHRLILQLFLLRISMILSGHKKKVYETKLVYKTTIETSDVRNKWGK